MARTLREQQIATKEQRRLFFVSLCTSLVFFIALLGLWLFDSLNPQELDQPKGPVRVSLGVAQASVQAPASAKPTASAPRQTELEKPIEKPAQEKPVAPPAQKPDNNSQKPNPSPATASTSKPSTEPASQVIKGSESGNAHETRFGGGNAEVGRSFYYPIADYMPLPSQISQNIGDAISDPLFRQFYSLDGDLYRQKQRVDLPKRPLLWDALAKAGYNLKRAEYKTENRLAPITIRFVVAGTRAGADPEIQDLRISSSSGNAEIDEAVIYAFKSASFFNNTDHAISGTFTYRFD